MNVRGLCSNARLLSISNDQIDRGFHKPALNKSAIQIEMREWVKTPKVPLGGYCIAEQTTLVVQFARSTVVPMAQHMRAELGRAHAIRSRHGRSTQAVLNYNLLLLLASRPRFAVVLYRSNRNGMLSLQPSVTVIEHVRPAARCPSHLLVLRRTCPSCQGGGKQGVARPRSARYSAGSATEPDATGAAGWPGATRPDRHSGAEPRGVGVRARGAIQDADLSTFLEIRLVESA
jgi:hypothetical protein